MSRTELEKWEGKLDAMLGEIDDLLEDKYADKYLLHPARPARGKTANKSYDGLIEIKYNFSLGLGSDLGEGYVITPRFVTLEFIPKSEMATAKEFVLDEVRKRLLETFPENTLSADWDGKLMKIHGDLSF